MILPALAAEDAEEALVVDTRHEANRAGLKTRHYKDKAKGGRGQRVSWSFQLRRASESVRATACWRES